VLKRADCRLIARRTLAWSALAFLSLQLVLAGAVEAWLPQVRDPEYAVRETRLVKRLACGNGQGLWLMLGSSRTQLGLQAARLDETAGSDRVTAFNFGMPGCGPLMQLICLDRLRVLGVRPKLLLVEINPAMLSWRNGEPLEERMLDGARLSLSELARVLPLCEQPRRVLGKWAWAQFAAGLRRAGQLRRWLAFDAADDVEAADYLMDDHGWQIVPWTADAERRRGLTRLATDQYDGALANFKPGAKPARALRALLNRCQEESVPVALVLMPEGSSFRKLYGPRAEPALQAFLGDLCREHDLLLIDGRRWVGDDLFVDGHHLLPDGAVAFTERFRRNALVVRTAAGPAGGRK